MSPRIILWRHGQTEYNLQGRVQGCSDIALNDTGLRQAKISAGALADYDIAEIVCSPLLRAVQTAQVLADLVGLEVSTDSGLVERGFGVFEGLTRAEMQEAYPEYYREWKQTGSCAEAGIESSAQVGRRVGRSIRRRAGLLGSNQTLLVVSHGSSIARGTVDLLGLDAGEWTGICGLDNCCWSILVPSARESHYRLAAHNLTPPGGVPGALPSMG